MLYNKCWVLAAALLFLHPSIKAQDTPANDGPYVFYDQDSIVVKSITSKNSRQQVHSTSYPLSGQKEHVRVAVRFADNKTWNFDVPLRKELEHEKSIWPQPGKMIVFSDIEGEFEPFRKLLIANKVIDKNTNWIFGTGHLVICGDLFDRGQHVTELLWFLYKLEQDAKLAGGYVHTILGNHDIMNLSGDIRYVQPKYFANAELMQKNYMQLYNTNTELGRWLRSKNLVEKIGDNLMLHGGISSLVNQLQIPLDSINNSKYYDKIESAAVTSSPILSAVYGFETSPFWYRGYFMDSLATPSQVDSTLQLYNVKKIIVGHTIAKPNVASYFNGKVLGVDVDHHNGDHQGALFIDNQWYVINTSGKRKPLLPYTAALKK